jgi:tripartite-type tricarboxylate transporter receptor subunit TctC
MVAEGISAQSGKPVIVENRPGGMTTIGAEAVARSEPDGYTLLFTTDDTFTVVPQLSKNSSFDPKELIPLALVGKIINVILLNPAVPVQTFPELIEYARKHPKELSFGSPSAGSTHQLTIELLKNRAKIDMLHVPYKGNAAALAAATSGEVQFATIGYGTAKGLIEAGKLRPIVISGPEREPALPDLPTTAELGFPEVDATTWLTISLPAKTPPEIVQQVSQVISRAVNDPETRKRIEARHIVPTDIGRKELAERIEARYKNLGEGLKLAGFLKN